MTTTPEHRSKTLNIMKKHLSHIPEDYIIKIENAIFIQHGGKIESYKESAKLLSSHLIPENNKYLSEAVISGAIDIDKLPTMQARELNLPLWESIDQYRSATFNYAIKGPSVVATKLYKCRKCGSACSYGESQTRSGDESSTDTVVCANRSCGFKFRLS